MVKIQNISEIQPTLGFTEFDILEKYRKSFNESELGRLHSAFPFKSIAKEIGLPEHRKHSNKCIFYTLRFGCNFAVTSTIKPQLL